LVEGYLTTKKLMQDERQDLASIFSKIDKNKSGFISMGELSHLFKEET
jgi:Ca2+-binding EF-hand superfamily protein